MIACETKVRRRCALFGGAASLLSSRLLFAAEQPEITVHTDPNCGCCSGWVQHLQKAGFQTNVIDTRNIDAEKQRLGVPDDLAACHIAEIAGYVMEGHVPASALRRFVSEKPNATGLAIPGMPIGSPGMEGGKPQPYQGCHVRSHRAPDIYAIPGGTADLAQRVDRKPTWPVTISRPKAGPPSTSV